MKGDDPFYREFIPGAIAFIASRRHPSYIPIDHSPRDVPGEGKTDPFEPAWKTISRRARLNIWQTGNPGLWPNRDDIRELYQHDPALALIIARKQGWITTPSALPHVA
nr:hypothetical protein [Rhodococcus sp. (in: high G+C Gram-positive bacteria)]